MKKLPKQNQSQKQLRNGIIYKYNKHIQVNGTLFYAFEYLCQVIENEIENPFYNDSSETYPDTNLYIQITKRYQQGYLGKLEELFKTKYPLWNRKVFSDKKILEKAKETLSEIEFIQLKHKVSIVNKAFARIKLVTGIELMKIKFNKVVFPSMNSYIDLVETVQFQEAKVIQNRQYKTITFSPEFPDTLLKSDKVTFLYELPNQQIPGANNQLYIPKLGFRFMVPKEVFKSYPKTDKIIGGKPISNQTALNYLNYQPSFMDTFNKLFFMKPSKFAQVNKGIFFLNTKEIDYHRNFLRWDENNRLIPEARYYGIKLNIINDITKESPYETFAEDISANKVVVRDPKTLSPDSSVPRYEDLLSNYILEPSDPLIKFLETKPE